MEGDRTDDVSAPPSAAFQSTPSAWRETGISIDGATGSAISIHSLRMEGDPPSTGAALNISHFNPLPPYGGRLQLIHCTTLAVTFQSTPSVWRETLRQNLHHGRYAISIHSLRMEGDNESRPQVKRCGEFQSTPSVWRETSLCTIIRNVFPISIHSLRMEGDP